MAKSKRIRKAVEAEIIRQADPTPEQRLKSQFAVVDAENPYKHSKPGEPSRTTACRRISPHAYLYQRGSIDKRTMAILEWYEGRWDRMNASDAPSSMGSGGGSNYGPTESQIDAASDVKLADSFIPNDCWLTWVAVMKEGKSILEHAGKLSSQRNRAKVLLVRAAKEVGLNISFLRKMAA